MKPRDDTYPVAIILIYFILGDAEIILDLDSEKNSQFISVVITHILRSGFRKIVSEILMCMICVGFWMVRRRPFSRARQISTGMSGFLIHAKVGDK